MPRMTAALCWAVRRFAASPSVLKDDQNIGYRRGRTPSRALTSAVSQSADHPQMISPYSSKTRLGSSCCSGS